MKQFWQKLKKAAMEAMLENLAMWAEMLQGTQKAMVIDFLSAQVF